jgi:hypothetical protein
LVPGREVVLSLVGRATTTEWQVRTPTGEHKSLNTVIEVATRPLVTGMPVDTLLAITISGAPTTGDLLMTPPTSITIRDVSPGIPIIFLEDSLGRVELMVFTRYTGFPAREFLQVEPATLRITGYVAPDPLSKNGLIRGTIDFMAEEYYREYAPDGAATIRKRDGKTRIQAAFEAQVEHRVRVVDTTTGS